MFETTRLFSDAYMREEEGGLTFVYRGGMVSYVEALRGGSLQRLVPEHNYAALLKQRLEGGEISQLLYDREIGRGRALTSYLGMNGIRLYAQNQYPLTLERGDVILLCSDGLLQALGTQALEALLSQPGTAQQLTKRLQTALLAHSGNMQDNTTLVLIKRHR